MMIVMKEGATEEQIRSVVQRVEGVGCSAHISQGEVLTVIGAIGDRDRVAALGLEGTPGVDHLVPILKPYKLASSQFRKGERTVIDVDGRKVGGDNFALIAGPCTVESREQTLETARAVAAEGVTMLRGGAFKPRTSPYAFQGLGEIALEYLKEAREETGLPLVTELMDPRHVEAVLEVADVIQIGARNMSNFSLLSEVGRAPKPVLLKRGLSSTVEDLLMAAEYIVKEGNSQVILCERGIKTFETSTRFTLDIGAIPVLKMETHLPVIVDPSHPAGRRELVLPLARAAVAAGAEGIIVEAHPRPEEALCDAAQQIPTADFPEFAAEIRALVSLMGRTIG
jgi:3-deoxy-7-phosphoheptulonate synthase